LTFFIRQNGYLGQLFSPVELPSSIYIDLTTRAPVRSCRGAMTTLL